MLSVCKCGNSWRECCRREWVRRHEYVCLRIVRKPNASELSANAAAVACLYPSSAKQRLTERDALGLAFDAVVEQFRVVNNDHLCDDVVVVELCKMCH